MWFSSVTEQVREEVSRLAKKKKAFDAVKQAAEEQFSATVDKKTCHVSKRPGSLGLDRVPCREVRHLISEHFEKCDEELFDSTVIAEVWTNPQSKRYGHGSVGRRNAHSSGVNVDDFVVSTPAMLKFCNCVSKSGSPLSHRPKANDCTIYYYDWESAK